MTQIKEDDPKHFMCDKEVQYNISETVDKVTDHNETAIQTKQPVEDIKKMEM